MPGSRHRHIRFDDLEEATKEQVFLLYGSLQEFEESCVIYLLNMRHNTSPMHKLARLIRNSQHVYLHGYYYEPRGALVPTILEQIGRPDMADSVRRLLARDVGGVTLRDALSTHRNTSVAHPTFTIARFDAALSGNAELFADAHVRLVQRTVALRRWLGRIYPEVAALYDEVDHSSDEEPPSSS